MDIEAIKRRVERIQTSNLSLVYPYQLIEDAESLLERVTALEAERDAAQHRANILAGCLTSVLQVVDGDPDDDCEYCGEIVSEGHDGRCIVPVARQALTAAPVREVELRAEEQAHNDALDEIERLTEDAKRLREAIDYAYPAVASRVIQLENSGETEAAKSWLRVARRLYDALSPAAAQACPHEAEAKRLREALIEIRQLANRAFVRGPQTRGAVVEIIGIARDALSPAAAQGQAKADTKDALRERFDKAVEFMAQGQAADAGGEGER